jgi:hypothetical protein
LQTFTCHWPSDDDKEGENLEERTVDIEQVRGWWGVEVEGGHSYKVHIYRTDEGHDRFEFYELYNGPNGEWRQNILSGRFEFEVESLNMFGERLHSSWKDEDGTNHEETSVYEGENVFMVNRDFGNGMDTFRVYRFGPFQHLTMEDDFEHTLPPSN